MKKYLILLILLLLPLTNALEEWHYSGDTWSEGQTIYKLLISNDYDLITLYINNTPLLIEKNHCEEYNLKQYCFERVSNITNNDPYRFNNGLELPILLKTIDIPTDIDVKVSYTKYLIPSQKGEINITLKSKTEKIAKNINLKTEITPGFTGNINMYVSTLYPNQSITKSYSFKYTTNKSIEVPLTLTYLVDNHLFKKTIKIKIQPIDIYTYNINVPKTLEKEQNLTITIKPKINLSLQIKIKSLAILINNSYEYSAFLTLNDSKTIVLPLKPPKIDGYRDLSMQLNFYTPLGNSTIEKTYTIEIKKPKPSITIKTSKNTIIENQSIMLTIDVKDSNKEFLIKPFNDTFTTHYEKEIKLNKPINITLIYDNEEIVKPLKVKILKPTQAIKIITKKEVNNNEVIINQYIEPIIPVMIKSMRDELNGLKLLQGEKERKGFLINKKTLMYTYKAEILNCSNITTIVEIRYNNQTFIKNQTTIIKECKKKTTTIEKKENKQEEKENIISSIFKSIARFISSILN